MLIPSIDLMGGKIVQLVQGEKKALEFDNFEYWIERFSRYAMVQVIDLDAARGNGNNLSIVNQVVERLNCQVGGGIRTAADGKRLLDAGAKRVIYGSSLFGAEPERDPNALEFADGAQEFALITPRKHRLIRLEFAAHLKKELGEDALCFSVDTKDGRVARTVF